MAFGELETIEHTEVDNVVRYALQCARWHEATHRSRDSVQVPTALVLEYPWGARRNPVRTLLAMGAARERWLRAWRDAGQRDRVVSVKPNEWRAVVLGRSCHGMLRADVTAIEQAWARRVTGDESVREEEAPAIGIGVWAERSREVGEAIGRRAREASERASKGGG